ncbi:hypothetical protein BDW72DRAFT_176021 [Aspergillus terricola var. indicus]
MDFPGGLPKCSLNSATTITRQPFEASHLYQSRSACKGLPIVPLIETNGRRSKEKMTEICRLLKLRYGDEKACVDLTQWLDRVKRSPKFVFSELYEQQRLYVDVVRSLQ